MSALVAAVFVASLLGSAHCAAMCGAFACLACDTPERRWGPSVAYHAARLAAYVALGLVAGLAGAGVDTAVAPARWTRPAAVVAGAILVAWGLARMLVALGVRVPQPQAPRVVQRLTHSVFRSVHARPPLVRAAAVGAIAPLLPCGWLYAFVATAAAAGSPLGGASVMAAFWAGTVPALALVAAGAQRTLGPARRVLPAVMAMVLVAVGAMTIAGAVRPARMTHRAHVPVDPHALHGRFGR